MIRATPAVLQWFHAVDFSAISIASCGSCSLHLFAFLVCLLFFRISFPFTGFVVLGTSSACSPAVDVRGNHSASENVDKGCRPNHGSTTSDRFVSVAATLMTESSGWAHHVLACMLHAYFKRGNVYNVIDGHVVVPPLFPVVFSSAATLNSRTVSSPTPGGTRSCSPKPSTKTCQSHRLISTR